MIMVKRPGFQGVFGTFNSYHRKLPKHSKNTQVKGLIWALNSIPDLPTWLWWHLRSPFGKLQEHPQLFVLVCLPFVGLPPLALLALRHHKHLISTESIIFCKCSVHVPHHLSRPPLQHWQPAPSILWTLYLVLSWSTSLTPTLLPFSHGFWSLSQRCTRKQMVSLAGAFKWNYGRYNICSWWSLLTLLYRRQGHSFETIKQYASKCKQGCRHT